MAPEPAQDQFTQFTGRSFRRVQREHVIDRPRHLRIRRNHFQRSFQRGNRIIYRNCNAAGSRHVHFAPDPVAIVVDHCILSRETGRLTRLSRGEARPDFAADRRPHAVAEGGIVDVAAQRRFESPALIAHCDSILIHAVLDILAPCFGQMGGGEPARIFFSADQPQQLQLQVIIRPEIQKQLFLRKVQPVRHPLVRSPQAASLRLPDPAGRHLISKPFQINSLHDIFTLL